jgi:hypothetical protein
MVCACVRAEQEDRERNCKPDINHGQITEPVPHHAKGAEALPAKQSQENWGSHEANHHRGRHVEDAREVRPCSSADSSLRLQIRTNPGHLSVVRSNTPAAPGVNLDLRGSIMSLGLEHERTVASNNHACNDAHLRT